MFPFQTRRQLTPKEILKEILSPANQLNSRNAKAQKGWSEALVADGVLISPA